MKGCVWSLRIGKERKEMKWNELARSFMSGKKWVVAQVRNGNVR
jgi:hypothetical protein